jgi:hypothetical protein
VTRQESTCPLTEPPFCQQLSLKHAVYMFGCSARASLTSDPRCRPATLRTTADAPADSMVGRSLQPKTVKRPTTMGLAIWSVTLCSEQRVSPAESLALKQTLWPWTGKAVCTRYG